MSDLSKILIVEDDLSIIELERDYLEINGYQVDMENDGIQGLRKAKENSYDLIILDVMLPGIDGFEICRQIRQMKDIPIILVSARKEDIDKIRGLGLGADDYVTKPFGPGELVARVKAHISRYERLVGNNKKPLSKDQIEIRDLVIDKSTRFVHLAEKELNLTTKEFDILFLLASNPDRVFSKEELFERIWELDSQGDLATVMVHIRKLREKMESDPSNPLYVETVWGVGYRFRRI